MVGQHEARNAMRRLDVRALLRQCDLDRRGSPRDERCEVSFTYPDQGLMNLWAGGSSISGEAEDRGGKMDARRWGQCRPG